jgi:maleylacetoacetate isomerase/maleylpyruvate isomerase
MSQMLLYNYFRSSTSFRVRIALHLKKIPFEYKPVALLKDEQWTAEYLKLNPLGGVPTLVHNGKVISESFAILEYLEEISHEHPLLPTDHYLRARIRQACEIINSGIHPIGNLRVQQYLERNYGFTPEQKEAWLHNWYAKGMQALETLLTPFAGQYCFGDTLTLADVFLIPQVQTSQRFNLDLKPYPTLMRINENCLKLEAFQKAHPFRQIDTPDEMRGNKI